VVTGAHAEDRMETRGDVDGPGPGQHEPGQHGLVQVAGHDDLVARSDGTEEEGVVAAGGAVGQEEAPVGAPGGGRERLGLLERPVAGARVQPHVGGEQLGPEQADQLVRGAGTQLVTGTGERDDPQRPVPFQDVDQGRMSGTGKPRNSGFR
jgi:hypothetical protein